MTDFQERFWRKVEKKGDDECWLWRGVVMKGYGGFKLNGRMMRSHRLSYQMYYGVDPKGLLVCHSCDTPSCVNPRHLFLGTAKENTWDMKKKGRAVNPRGSHHGQAKLNEEQVRRIKFDPELYGLSQYQLAAIFGVSRGSIEMIKRGITWSHVTDGDTCLS